MFAFRFLALGLLCLATLEARSLPVPKDQPQQILIVSKNKGKGQFILMNADGTNSRTITEESSNASYPAWSPDGRQIAFCSDRDGGVLHIFVMDADGGNVKQLTKGPIQCRVPTWTPDGKTIAFGMGQGQSRICKIATTGGDPENVSDDDFWDPAYSPDGKQLAFVSTRDGGFRLFVSDADGSNIKGLLNNGNNIGFGYPSWSPDGKKIAFGHLSGGRIELHLIDADGKNLKQISNYGGTATYAHWSPDGKNLAYLRFKQENAAEVVVTDAKGDDLKVIAKDLIHVEGGRPQWRPRR